MQCQICKSKKIEQYKIVEGVAIYQCLSCKLAFVDPQTPRKKTSHIYSFSDYKKREDQFIKRYQKTVQLVKKYSKGKRILEVGAGFGLLSSMLSKERYLVDVLEPDVEPVYLKGSPVRIYKEYLEKFSRTTKNKYDVIILYDVLEHVDFPGMTVEIIKALLTSEGIVLIQTPNYQSLMAKIVHRWSWWMVEDHRYFFSKKSLNLLFDKENWKNIFYKTYEEWPDFKKNLDGNFKNKVNKIIFFGWFIPFYFLGRELIWECGYGGLHIAIWQYNRR